MENSISHIFEQYPNKLREDLIPILNDIQQEFGYLPEQALQEVSAFLSLSVNKVYGVATFYDNFRFVRQGKFHIRVCTGTACKMENASVLVTELEKQLKINPGQTDPDFAFSLEVVSCLGGCSAAPVIEVNGDYFIEFKATDLKFILSQLRAKVELL